MRRHPPCYHPRATLQRVPKACRPMRELTCPSCARVITRWPIDNFGMIVPRPWPEEVTTIPVATRFFGYAR